MKKEYTPADFRRHRQDILDDIIDECTRHFADNRLPGITRMTCKRIAIELNALRNEGWCAPEPWDISTAMDSAVTLDTLKQDD